MRAAVCQLASSGDVVANRRAAVEAVRTAALAGATLVVLPEAMQRAFGQPTTDLRPDAEPVDGPFVSALVAEAARGDGRLVVVAGMFEPGDDRRVFNTLVALDGDGLVGSYRKVHLYDALGWRESDRVMPGDAGAEPLIIPVAEHQLGIMTCYDLRFPEPARRLAVAGATVMAVPAAWVSGPGKGEQWTVLLQARAIEETAYVLGADQPQPETTGLSAVVNPRGHVMTSLDESSTAVAVADLELDEVEKARRLLPLVEGRRYDVRPRTPPRAG